MDIDVCWLLAPDAGSIARRDNYAEAIVWSAMGALLNWGGGTFALCSDWNTQSMFRLEQDHRYVPVGTYLHNVPVGTFVLSVPVGTLG
jgi:hypothetical protein